MLGQALAYAPNVGEAVNAAARILFLIDRIPNVKNPKDSPIDNHKFEGNVAYKDTEFEYPTRPGITVLKGLNLDIQKNQTIALVGPSGCGKVSFLN